MIRRPPRSTLDRSSAASDVYKRQLPRFLKRGLPLLGLEAVFFERCVLAKARHLYEPAHRHPAKRGVEEAVSYTHLRAHETVLDLVCRLLLEKKQTKKKKKQQKKTQKKHTALNHKR
mgnify:CR=1 FL=1